MQWLCLAVFALFCTCAYAQEKGVSVSAGGVSTNVNKSDLKDATKKHLGSDSDSLLQRTIVSQARDTIVGLSDVVPQKVFSQKQWRVFADSLRSIPIVNIPELPDIAKEEVSERELAQAANKEFTQSRDSVSREYLDKAAFGLPGKPALPKTPVLSDALGVASDIRQLTLPRESLQSLIPMPLSRIRTKYIDKLDSIRSVNLDREKLRLKEYRSESGEQLSQFTQKPDFRDRSYFEGVLGFSPGNFTILQAAPTLGIHFVDNLSLGAGPNLTVRQETKKVITSVGIKTFFKAEFWQRRMYLQLEDVMDNYGSAAAREEGRSLFQQHNVFAGGGFLLSTKAPLTLNFSILYCITNYRVVSYDYSPMVFRIGLSSLKLKDK